MGKSPLIGISCDFEPKTAEGKSHRVRQNQDYATRLAEAGALPVNLPLEGDPEALAEELDGSLIPGGEDIDPAAFGKPMGDKELKERHVSLISKERFGFEQRLYHALRRAGKPIFGICYGMQFINVMEGGSLIVDLATERPDSMDHRWKGSPQQSLHPVTIESGTFLAEIVARTEYPIVSSHHQAVLNPAAGLRISAWAADGVIEAVETTEGGYLLGVQWHPERQPDSVQDRRLFEAFVEAAREG